MNFKSFELYRKKIEISPIAFERFGWIWLIFYAIYVQEDKTEPIRTPNLEDCFGYSSTYTFTQVLCWYVPQSKPRCTTTSIQCNYQRKQWNQ